eukprot:6208841-Pleurochrysis_carterae.AAC.1
MRSTEMRGKCAQRWEARESDALRATIGTRREAVAPRSAKGAGLRQCTPGSQPRRAARRRQAGAERVRSR